MSSLRIVPWYGEFRVILIRMYWMPNNRASTSVSIEGATIYLTLPDDYMNLIVKSVEKLRQPKE